MSHIVQILSENRLMLFIQIRDNHMDLIHLQAKSTQRRQWVKAEGNLVCRDLPKEGGQHWHLVLLVVEDHILQRIIGCSIQEKKGAHADVKNSANEVYHSLKIRQSRQSLKSDNTIFSDI